MITVVIADDDPFVCLSLRTILEAQDDIQVAAVAGSGIEAEQLYEKHNPDVLLMDIQMPEGDGLAAGERVLEKHPDARVVYLTTFADDEYIVRALRLGAKGYLIKQQVGDIAPALRAVVDGQSVLGSEILGRMDRLAATLGNAQAVRGGSAEMGESTLAEDTSTSASICGSEMALSVLSEREQAIVCAVAQGLDNKEIAAKLYLSEGTVRNHISTALQKTHLKNRTQLAIWYLRQIPQG